MRVGLVLLVVNLASFPAAVVVVVVDFSSPAAHWIAGLLSAFLSFL